MDTSSRTRPNGRAATGLAAAALVMALALGASSHAQSAALRDLLPDLQAGVPDHVSLAVHQGRAFVGFDSAVVNRGEGPLEVQGTRSSTARPGLPARQVVTRSDGTTAAVRDVGALRFVTEPGHRYWHLDDVMRYELRTASSFRLVAAGTRRGYCLRDGATFSHHCGRGRPRLLSLTMGVGPAQRSRYAPISEGQSFDMTHVTTGRYWLVTRVDPDRRFVQSDTTNDASSVLISFTNHRVGRAHKVRLTLIGACPGVERCSNPESFAR